MKKGVRIGELAGACGVSPDTIRFYERKGLLPQPRRTGAGHRIYDDSAPGRVMFIRRAHEIGLSLADVHELLRLRERGHSLCGPLAERLAARLTAVEQKLDELTQTRRVLKENIERCDESGRDSCPVVEFIENRSSPQASIRREA
jgi:MerR family mercuric resistance operon transcriptional regulator